MVLHEDDPVGTVRVPHGDQPRNHHGDPVAPISADGRPYRYAWTDDRGDTLYALTGDHLLNAWIPGYLDQTPDEQARTRAEHAVRVRTELVATLAAQAAPGALAAEQEAVLLADLAAMPDISHWDAAVPLVLLEGMYRPFTERIPPISGSDGDVRDPSNIIWLRHSSGDAYVESLAHAGYITVDTREG